MSGRGAERILDAIEWFAASTTPVLYSDFVKALNLPKSSALLLLRLLVERGYIERLPDNRYRLVRLPGERADGGETWGTILRLADGPLREAVAHAEESGFVAVLENGRVRYLNKVLPTREIRYDRDITSTRIPHQVASGIVLLSGFSDEALAAYFAAAGVSPAEEKAISENIAKARRDGVFTNLNGVVEGAAGVSAPIRDSQGRIPAAINISGPKERFIANLDRVTEAVVRAAQAVSAEIARRKPRPMSS